MSKFHRDAFFASSLESIFKTKNKEQKITKIKQLEDYIFSKVEDSQISLALKLAFELAAELDFTDQRITRLQNFIINSNNSRYIFKFAREIRKANITKLQEAIIQSKDIFRIALFGCFIPNADKRRIENIIAKSNNAKAAYLFIKYYKYCDIKKLKHIILKSKKPRYLFALALKTSNKKDLLYIQDTIIASSSNLYVRLFAKHIKSADISKLEDRIIASRSIRDMKRFAKDINSPRLEKLSLLF